MSDQKDAVNIGITLSTQLIAASLAMIAIAGSFTALIIDKRNVGIFFYIAASSTFISFVISIFQGGKGIDIARKDGFSGIWNLTNTKNAFNCQAFWCLLGISFFIISVFLGEEKDESLENRLWKYEKKINQLSISDLLNQVKIIELENNFKTLQNKKCDTIYLIKDKD